MANVTTVLSAAGFPNIGRNGIYNLFLQLTGVEAGATSTHYVVRNASGSIKIDTTGSGFTYVGGFAATGTYTSAKLFLNNVAIAQYSYSPGISIPQLNAAIQQFAANGSTAALDSLYSQTTSTINGSNGNDVLFGLNNADIINGNGGRDILFGGIGADVLNAGATTLDANGFGFDMAIGDAGADRFNVGPTGANHFIVNYALETGTRGVVVNLAANAATDTFGNTDSLVGVTFVIGTNRADILVGDTTNDFLAPGGGNDTINGGGGIDELDYYFIKQFNSDAFAWTRGIVVVHTGDNAGRVTDPSGGTDTFSNVERIAGTRFPDTFNGSDFADAFIGGAGGDRFVGGLGLDDVIYSQEVVGGGTLGVIVNLTLGTGRDPYGATDSLSGIERVFGTNQADSLIGDAQNNTFSGLGGIDTLFGAAGGDILYGGLGNDQLSGSTGADAFVFDTALVANVDTITDFAVEDTIVLENAIFTAFAGLVAGTAIPAVTLRSGAGLTSAGDANDFIIYNTTTGDLYYDEGGTAGSAAIKFATLSTRPALTSADFLIA